jgi:hypothetical protein
MGAMPSQRSAGPPDWVRVYLLLTALESAVEDAVVDPGAELHTLHSEHARMVGSARVGSADELLRRELRYARRLLDALCGGSAVDDRVLSRPERSCASLGCGNDAIGRYCLSCDAHRAR